MRPVNLLPAGERARTPAAGGSGNASYVVLGVLGALLLATVGWVMTQNQINSHTSEIARVTQEKEAAEQRAARLAAFGDFAAIKETRVKSVTDLARQRFDWERLMRELALVLPEGTWLTQVAASSTPESAELGDPALAAEATATGPSISLTGCSESQERVAVLLVRLRNLHRASDVQLSESAEDDSAGTSSGGSSAPDAASAGGSDECRFFTFQATVTFAPATGDEPQAGKRRVPASLGGGA